MLTSRLCGWSSLAMVRASPAVPFWSSHLASLPGDARWSHGLFRMNHQNSFRRARCYAAARERQVRIQMLGVRGSTPAPGPDFVRYGGHTSCLAITPEGSDRPTLVLDAGTGLR